MKDLKNRAGWLKVIMAFIFLFSIGRGEAQAAGLLKPLNGPEAKIYMKSHKVDVVINNGFARTEVDQVFVNEADVDMEATYSFPLPQQASLSELSLWINGQEVIGEVLEKEKAKEIYEEEKNRGNDSALAEKDDYKTFNVYVALVRAGVDTRVRLVYYQPLEIDLNVGRYVYPLAEGGVDEERISFWEVDNKIKESFLFNLKLKSAFPVSDVRLPGYQDQAIVRKVNDPKTQEAVDLENSSSTSGEELTEIQEREISETVDSATMDKPGEESLAKEGEQNFSGDTFEVILSQGEGASLSKDIVFYYRLSDDVPARVELIPYKEAQDKEGTFMVVVTPGASLKRIAEGTDWTFILDNSGSMSGAKINTLAEGVAKVLGKMSPLDRFRIVTFNERAEDFSHGYILAEPQNIKRMISRIKSIQAGRGTNLYAGLELGLKDLDQERTTGIVLVTDGVANIGLTQQADFLDLLKGCDVRLFTFIIGNSANVPLLERLTKDSGGFALSISDSDDIVGRIIQAKTKVLHENLHDVELKFKGEKVKQLTPEKLKSLYIGQQLIMFGKYFGEGEIELELSAKISGQEQKWSCPAFLPGEDRDNPEIERLWALSAIEDIMEEIREKGENKALRGKVVALGEEYSLVTDYTSMLVVQDQVMEDLAIQRRNNSRVDRERKAGQNRASAPIKNYSVSRNPQRSSQRTMFNGVKSQGIGTGPVGPLGLIVIFWLNRKKKRSC